MRGCEFDTSDAGKGQLEGSYENDDEFSGSITR
jgi:hypothetical protein